MLQQYPESVLEHLLSEAFFDDVGGHSAQQALVNRRQLDLPRQNCSVPLIKQLIIVLGRSTVLLHVFLPLRVALHRLK